MNDKPRKIRKILIKLGIQRISYRPPLKSETILSDLKDLARRLGRTWPIKSKTTRKKNKHTRQ